MSERGEQHPIDPSIEAAILDNRNAQRAPALETNSPSLGAANPEDVRDQIPKPTVFQGERTALWGKSRSDLESLRVSAQAALDGLVGKEDGPSNKQRKQASVDLEAATSMLEKLDAAKKVEPAVAPDVISRMEDRLAQQRADREALQAKMAEQSGPVQSQHVEGSSADATPIVLEAADAAPFRAKAIETGVLQQPAPADAGRVTEEHIETFINRNTSPAEQPSTTTTDPDNGKLWNPETFQLVDPATIASSERPTIRIETATAPSATIEQHLEGAAEQRERTVETEKLDAARNAYTTKLQQKKKWLSAPSDKVLEAARVEYVAATQEALVASVKSIKTQFEGKDLQDPAIAVEFQGALIGATLKHRSAEEQKLRESLRGNAHARVLDDFRTAWKRHSKARMVLGATLSGAAMGTAAAGLFPVSAVIMAARGILTGTGTFLMTESAANAARKNFGETKERSEPDIKKLSLGEVERALAAHTMLQVDEGLQEFGVQKKGILRKRNDVTGKMLQDRHDELLREQAEKIITAQLKKGDSLDAILETMVIGGELDAHRQGKSLEQRIKTNRRASIAIGTAAGIAGAIAGVLGFNAAQRFADAHQAKEHATEVAQGGFTKLQEAGTSDFHNPFTAEGRAAIEAAKATAIQHIETAQQGDSVWSLTERYVSGAYPKLSPEQKTWMIDSIKDKLAAHPELIGLKDVNHITPGATIDFDKLGIDYTAISGKASALTSEATNAIHEHLASHADHVASTVEAGSQAAVEHGVATAATPTELPAHLRDIPVMVQDRSGNLVEMGSHLQSASETAVQTSEWLNPASSAAYEHFNDARSVWETEVMPGTMNKWLESLGQLSTTEAVKPGVLEGTFASIGSNDPMVEAKMAEAVREMIRALPPDVIGKATSVSEVLTKVTSAAAK